MAEKNKIKKDEAYWKEMFKSLTFVELLNLSKAIEDWIRDNGVKRKNLSKEGYT